MQKSTVLVVDLAYSVQDFDTGKYFVLAQFDTDTDGITTDGTFNRYPVLKNASGTYRLCYPLTDIWNAPGVKRPLTVRFLLNQIDGPRFSHGVAFTDPISFPTN